MRLPWKKKEPPAPVLEIPRIMTDIRGGVLMVSRDGGTSWEPWEFMPDTVLADFPPMVCTGPPRSCSVCGATSRLFWAGTGYLCFDGYECTTRASRRRRRTFR